MTWSSSSRAHLGETAAALVDGELGHGARDRALAHLTHCDSCRREVDEQRRTKARLAALGRPAVPVGLTERLRAIGADLPTNAPRSIALRPRAGRPPSRSGPRRPAGRPARLASRRSRVRLAASGLVAACVLGLGTAFVAGGSPDPGPSVSPAVDNYAVQHAATTGAVSFPEPAVGYAVSDSFSGTSTP